MTALLETHKSIMDVSHTDDKMELGTSPYPLVDDIDFELEPDRQHSVDRSMADDVENMGNSTDLMQADGEDLFKDDDMLDEEDDDTMQQSYDDVKEDFNMDFYADEDVDNPDGEIIYNEMPASIDINKHSENQLNNEELPESEELHIDGDVQNPAQPQAENTIEPPDLSNTNQNFEDSQPTEPLENHAESHASANENSTDVNSDTAAHTDTFDFAAQESTIEQNGGQPDDSSNHSVLQVNEEHVSQSLKHETTDQPNEDKPLDSNDSEVEKPGQAIEETTLEDTEDHETQQGDSGFHETTQSLHPVTVVYLEQEMSLFPPMVDDSSATFFLSDPSLAFEAVESLLASCRDILGETLEHDDELVLDIPALGLHICEDSKYASQITLSQIIDVYLMLSRNESSNNIEPLYCILSSRVCLASQYSYLMTSASEGKTYTEIAAEYDNSPDLSENSNDDQQDAEDFTNESEKVVPSNDAQDIQDESILQHEETVKPTDNLTATDIPDATTQASIQSSNDVEVDVGASHNEELHRETVRRSSHPTNPLEADTEAHGEEENINEDDSAQEHNKTGETYQEAEYEEDASASSHTVEEEVVEGTKEQSLPNPEAINAQNDSTQQVDRQNEDDVDGYRLDDEIVDRDPTLQQAENYENLEGFTGSIQDVGQPINGSSDHDAVPSMSKDEINDDDFEFDENVDLFEGKDELDNPDDLDVLKDDAVTATAPVTPSKQIGNKRKAIEDEDELDLLDLSTPEPKRTRSS